MSKNNKIFLNVFVELWPGIILIISNNVKNPKNLKFNIDFITWERVKEAGEHTDLYEQS